VASEIRDAASVILVRPRDGGGPLEVFLLRRHKRSGFMASAFVFPGGIAEPSDTGPRNTAARELFEEAGILIGAALEPEDREAIRERAVAGGDANALLAEAGATFDLDALHYYAHWITPSIEPRRYSARFYVARLPAGQQPRFDNVETVEQLWVTPGEALERAGELRLPPPQVRTFMDMASAADRGWRALVDHAAERAARPAPILPRMAPAPSMPSGFALLLPWDPEYRSRGTGDAHPLEPDHPLASGPSRFVLEDQTWRNVAAPALTDAGS
jgi:8-oxo-dGTP pyrophosphatase MutT (NUDIX family)